MSAEQIRGRRDLDARTDVYAIGAILYEAFTGELPFDAETLTELAIALGAFASARATVEGFVISDTSGVAVQVDDADSSIALTRGLIARSPVGVALARGAGAVDVVDVSFDDCATQRSGEVVPVPPAPVLP